ncbi:hypothetical protein AMTRI_Chr02g222730 [Amborella trichopoda]
MDGNKDEALRCAGIAKAALLMGDKLRALKFIGIARRLDHNLPLDDLFAACESLNDESRERKTECATQSMDSRNGDTKERMVGEDEVGVHGEEPKSNRDVKFRERTDRKSVAVEDQTNGKEHSDDDDRSSRERFGHGFVAKEGQNYGKEHGSSRNRRSRDRMGRDFIGCGSPNYSEENVQLIREIKRNKDYYAILGVEKSSSVEEIRRAYRKLSLKVHPDKNKAPGSEEAFKIVSKAFNCLRNEESRHHYDQTGLVEDSEVLNHQNMRRRRTRNTYYYEENFDPNEIFRSFFFSQQEHTFQTAHMHRAREMREERRRNDSGDAFNFMIFLQIVPLLLFFLFAFLPTSEPNYSLQRTHSYHIRKVTEKYGVEFFVKSPNFDQDFPLGSPSRTELDDYVVRDYKNVLSRYCHMELQRSQWVREYPTPHCDRLRDLKAAL